MKRNFTEDNFEDFLRQSADGLRMRPSAEVWKGIANQLEKKRRKGGLLFGSLIGLLCLGGYLAVDEVNHSFAKSGEPQTTVRTTATAAPQQAAPLNPAHATQLIAGQPQSRPALAVASRNTSVPAATGTRSLPRPILLAVAAPETTEPAATASFEPAPVDDYGTSGTGSMAAVTRKDEERRSGLPYSIESVVNSYRTRFRKNRWSWQFYAAPTISYRKLSENKEFLRNGADINPNLRAAALNSVNNVVTHKPDLGLEVGMAAKYALSERLRLKGGLQLNVNRYNIKAYSATTEVATIMFNSGRADSLNLASGLSNVDGYAPNWLENYYFQISAPIGVEYRIGGTQKLNFGVATTIQPTYILGDRTYLLSTDYKNYAEIPDLTRRWNVNTSFETFVGFPTGSVNWQVGPQIRYQLLSSYISKYPIKENLFDFGLRVGLSLKK